MCQWLLDRADGRGRVPAVEVLVNTARLSELVVDPARNDSVERIIAEGQYHGMQAFDHSLFTLYTEGLVTMRDIMRVAHDPEDLRIAIHQAGLGAA